MNSNKFTAILLTGLMWVFLGIGFFTLYFRYLPEGSRLAVEAVGLFLAGIISGLLYTGVRSLKISRLGTGLVSLGYILFVPVAIMLGLLVSTLINLSDGTLPLRMLILTPIAIALFSNVFVAIGLGFTAGLAASASSLSGRVEGVRILSAPVRIR